MKYVFLPEALIALAPNKGFVIDGEYELKNVTWNKDVTASDIPTDEGIIKKCEELQADYDSKSYARNRQQKFPNEHDLLIALWEKVMEDRSESADALQAIRKQIKSDNPKP